MPGQQKCTNLRDPACDPQLHTVSWVIPTNSPRLSSLWAFRTLLTLNPPYPPLLQTCSLVATPPPPMMGGLVQPDHSAQSPPSPPPPHQLSKLSFRSLRTPSLKADGPSPADPLRECCSIHATNSLKWGLPPLLPQP